MKKALIMVLSSDWPPYSKMITTSQQTWDSVHVEGTDTVFYCSYSDKVDTDKVIYLPVDNGLYDIGKKTLLAFEWALKNKDFDYLSRPQANGYINKKELIKYVQTLPDEKVFATIEVDTVPRWGWGVGTLLSRDIVKTIVDNKDKWDHHKMEDVAMSQLVDKLGIPWTKAMACSIDRMPDGWRCIVYGDGTSFSFKDFSEIVKAEGHFFFRCKQDYNREEDAFVMKELFKYLK